MAIQYKKYEVNYIDKKKKGNKKTYISEHALCVDGAEEAARLDCKNLKEITEVYQLV